MANSKRTDERYWAEYNNLQRVKHRVIQKYLGAWYPILTAWNGRVLYLETHAGRGKHGSGTPGSPLIAIEALLSHRSRDAILKGSEIVYVFTEIDQDNIDQLKKEIGALGALPKGVEIQYIHDD